MRRLFPEPAGVTDTRKPPLREARLERSWLFVARASWMVLTFCILILNVTMLPRYNALLQAHCQPGPQCFAFQLTAYDRHLLQQLGLSLGFLAASQVLLNTAIVVVNCALGLLIFWQRSTDRMELFCAFMLVLFGGVGLPNILLYTLMPTSPAWFVLIGTFAVLGQSGFFIFFLLFPSGRFVPGFTRWVALCIVLYWIYTDFSANIFSPAGIWQNLALFVLVLCTVGAQAYRYRRVSTARERQQTKWVVFGFTISIVGFVLVVGLGNALLSPTLQQSSVISLFLGNTLVDSFFFLIPISIALAILCSRLYDIDVIINRTLVYSLLTGLLVAIYAGLTIGLESLVGLVSRQTSQPVIVVLSTLAIAALFQPLRARIQMVIDRRFYRRKYNAARIVEAFNVSLRSEVDLNQLSEHVLTVVQETLQPTHASLWLRQPERDDKMMH